MQAVFWRCSGGIWPSDLGAYPARSTTSCPPGSLRSTATVESRRGGGGYIRITRVHVDRQTLMMHVINSIGSEIDPASARAILSNLVQSEAIPAQTGKLLASLLSDTALRSVPKDQRSVLRADLLKQALIHLV